MKVIIAIDELACANQTVQFASEHNWGDTPEIKLVHVISPMMVDVPLASFPLFLEEAFAEAEKEGKQLLGEAAARLSGKLSAKVETVIEVGYPTSVLVDMAREWGADMIILGTHGRHGVSRFFLGSVSGEVAAQSPCSVLVLQIERTAKAKVKEPMISKAAAAAG